MSDKLTLTENKMKNEKYSVITSKFMGSSDAGYTYEITLNKSLQHTGRFKGIEDGLNKYVANEKKQERKDIIKDFFRLFKFW